MAKFILMCRHKDETKLVSATKDTTLDYIMEKITQTWGDLKDSTSKLYYFMADETKCIIETDEDVHNMFDIAEADGMTRVKIDVAEAMNTQPAPTESSHAIVEHPSRTYREYTQKKAGDVQSSRKSRKRRHAHSDDDTETDHSMYSTEDDSESEDEREKEAAMYSSTITTRETTRITIGWGKLLQREGQKFRGGADEFREVLQKHSVGTRFRYIYIKNVHNSIKAICELHTAGCQWKCSGRVETQTGHFVVKKLNNVHTCGTAITTKKWNTRLTSKLISKHIINRVRDNPAYSAKNLKRSAVTEFGQEFSYKIAWRSVRRARDVVYGDVKSSFNCLPAYVKAIEDSNPGSVVHLDVNKKTRRFERLFIAFDAAIKGFAHCRPLLFLDGTHLKFEQHGHLLAATGKDGNDGIYPLAFAIVTAEDSVEWEWFLTQLKSLKIPDRTMTFVTDRSKGLVEGLNTVFPKAHHSYCLHHLEMNLRSHFKGRDETTNVREKVVHLLYQCAYASTVEEYNIHMEKLLNTGGKRAKRFLENLDPKHWANAFFEGCRYGHVASTLSESFNYWIYEPRNLPVQKCADEVRIKQMKRFEERRNKAALKFKSPICKKIDKKLYKLGLQAADYPVVTSSYFKHEVNSEPRASVDLEERTCSCKEWQRKGYPCEHVMAVINNTDHDLAKYVDPGYLTQSFIDSYQYSINPIPGPFNIDPENEVKPPLQKRKPGRPKEKRHPSRGEKRKKRLIQCKNCGEMGSHNKRTCPNSPKNTATV